MSTSRTVTIWCDGVNGAGCDEWTHAGEESHRGATDTQARTSAKRMGWGRVAKFDLCPECLAEARVMVHGPR